MVEFLKVQLRLHRITREDVWAMADEGKITEAQAEAVAGARVEPDKDE
jgi:hypothetical protein